MIAPFYSSKTKGPKIRTHDVVEFGWDTIEKIFTPNMARAEQGLSRNAPGLKFAFPHRYYWIRLNVRPAKIMQVPSLSDCIWYYFQFIR